MLTEKQREYIHNADRRWNIKVGATRSGKTYCDLFMIPKRIRACSGSGTVVLLGTTVTTLCRNIIDPLREKWGEFFVGKPTSKDTVMLFGRKCWLIGAMRGDQAAKLQGSGIEYAYGDEITTWSREVFEMLKSRLDRPGSHFDGTCNPSSPDHWLKKFLESDADIYCQHYTIDDNPNLDPSFVQALKSEYAGTVYYDRFILGKWCAPEGMIYRRFANDTSSYTVRSGDMRLGRLTKVTVGVDFGGNRSGTAFVACGVVGNYDTVIALMSERHMCGIDSDRLGELFCDFIEAVTARYGAVQTRLLRQCGAGAYQDAEESGFREEAYGSDKARAEISGQRQDTSCQPADGAGEVPCDGGMRDADRGSVHRAVEVGQSSR